MIENIKHSFYVFNKPSTKKVFMGTWNSIKVWNLIIFTKMVGYIIDAQSRSEIHFDGTKIS